MNYQLDVNETTAYLTKRGFTCALSDLATPTALFCNRNGQIWARDFDALSSFLLGLPKNVDEIWSILNWDKSRFGNRHIEWNIDGVKLCNTIDDDVYEFIPEMTDLLLESEPLLEAARVNLEQLRSMPLERDIAVNIRVPEGDTASVDRRSLKLTP
jgi:hypothetical protein